MRTASRVFLIFIPIATVLIMAIIGGKDSTLTDDQRAVPMLTFGGIFWASLLIGWILHSYAPPPPEKPNPYLPPEPAKPEPSEPIPAQRPNPNHWKEVAESARLYYLQRVDRDWRKRQQDQLKREREKEIADLQAELDTLRSTKGDV